MSERAVTRLPHLVVTPEIGPVAGLLVLNEVRAAVERSGRCLLAVPGGTTPAPIFRWLASYLPPELVRALTVVPVDERHLPLPDGPIDASTWRSLPEDSNLRLLWAHWLALTPVVPEVLTLDAPGPLDRARVAVDRSVPGDPDVVLLGLGPDGHVASLFPGRRHDATDRVVAVADSPKPPPERLTFSLASLCRAAAVIVVATGSAKADAVRRSSLGDPELPLSALRGPTVRWVIDPAAASLLQEST